MGFVIAMLLVNEIEFQPLSEFNLFLEMGLKLFFFFFLCGVYMGLGFHLTLELYIPFEA